MSPYNPDIHHRHSIRLKGYDYASKGQYLITICTQNCECLFGEIKNVDNTLYLPDIRQCLNRHSIFFFTFPAKSHESAKWRLPFGNMLS